MGTNHFYWNVVIISITFLFLLVVPWLIWLNDRKSQWLSDYKTIVEEQSAALRSAAWGVIIYLASLPLLIMLYIGAVTLVSVKPTWNLSLSITIIIVNLLYMFLIIVLPLLNLLVTTVHLGAAEINVYIQNERPLEYYKSKQGFQKK